MLDSWRETIKNIVYSKKFIGIVLLAALLTAVAFYFYNSYIAPRLNPTFVTNKELQTASAADSGVNDVDVLYFYTDWCPFCKKARPAWDKIKEKYNEKPLNGKTLFFKEINCEKDEKMADQYNIEGYPTIKMIKGDQVVDYDAKPTEKSLTEFLNTST